MLVVALLMMSSAIPALARNNVVMRGIGVSSCGEWTEDHKTPNSSLAAAGDEWLLGWISGVMVYFGDGNGKLSDLLKNSDNAALLEWMSNYCQDHPLEPIGTAALRLFVAIDKQAYPPSHKD